MLMKLKVLKIIRIMKTTVVIVIVMMTIFLSEKSILINNTLKSPGHPTNYAPNSTFHSDGSIQDRSFLLLLNSSGRYSENTLAYFTANHNQILLPFLRCTGLYTGNYIY